MQDIEPYYHWREFYISAEDEYSPFHGVEYSEFEFCNTVYNFFIHPQWDQFGSSTLYTKVLFADYEIGYAIMEFIGEWNDALYNDIMFLKREVIEPMIQNGINKFILIGENVLNFHGSDDCYYEEWFQDIEDGWIAAVNFRKHVLSEFYKFNIDSYMVTGGDLDTLNWRTFHPAELFILVENLISRRLN
ncbi:MAG: hypothetical protein DWQ44_00260 [Bacteroidetes bacterium]|nr:MAG: hypothetical protein DWQ33_03635 [Bacteroidota bacterium]REK07620.1 MAG: hypothetical protein DWQ39_01635 [Bacteroidota bacterium]REK36948.1 MAG: hypothetical protein DWQ44_00260 [Bacteroidota bacterium]REK47768.1 MAG: hypothetical protein DWQ48_11320 [Bacteroidota bacterium]